MGAGTDQAERGIIATTDEDGIARTRFRTRFKVGRRVGIGNHKVRANVVGYDDRSFSKRG